MNNSVLFKQRAQRYRLSKYMALLSLCGASMLSHANSQPDYYQGVDPSSQLGLHNSLHEIIDDHQRFPYTSSATDTWDILEAADQDPDASNRVIDVYKNASYLKQGGGNSFYNREHSWPKSYGFPDDGASNYPYTDAHHLFISQDDYNSSRSNKPFANCADACQIRATEVNHGRGGPGQANYTKNESWETWDGRKGDIARAMMYMAVRYEGGKHGDTGYFEPDLRLTDDRSLIEQSSTGSNLDVAYMGLRSVLIAWHKQDPVDDFERQRNDTIYLFQGNRNPFIDHPEWVACVFENICGNPGDTIPPAPPNDLKGSVNQLTIQLNWTANNEIDLLGYNIYQGTIKDGPITKINTSPIINNNYTITNLTPLTTYYYQINAVDTSGNTSAFSNTVELTTDDTAPQPSSKVWINEIHYDNNGGDQNEGIEIAGKTGINLNGWRLVAYNGSNGQSYSTVQLSGEIPDQQNSYGTVFFNINGLQNGSPDGIALVNDTDQVVQFLSYEGSFTANNGIANGLTADDIGVKQTSNTPIGFSLQLSGQGSQYQDFIWQNAAKHTYGQPNLQQNFTGDTNNQPPTAKFSSQCNGLICTFDASQSQDTDGNISNYQWDLGDGNANTGLIITHSYEFSGDYNVSLTVTDNQNSQDTITAMVSVNQVSTQPWINEIHYDNQGSDINEGVEIAGVAGTNLTDWRLEAYNGKDGKLYKTVNLSGTIANQMNGFGVIHFAISGLQNGSPDGIALVNNADQVVQFISYEGSFIAKNGAAVDRTAEDIGVAETSNTPVDFSLQLTGNGTQYSDFNWEYPATKTTNSINHQQTFGSNSINLPPEVAFDVTCNQLTCLFDASNTKDPDGSIVNYTWDFGNDDNAAGMQISYTYDQSGIYSVTLTATDDQQSKSSLTQDVTIDNSTPNPGYFESKPNMLLADNTRTKDRIKVDYPQPIGLVSINIDISHDYRGDISLRLIPPNNQVVLLKQKSPKDSKKDINQTYQFDATGIVASGKWRLVIKDHYTGDTGTLNAWSIQL